MGEDFFNVFLLSAEGSTFLLADRGAERPAVWPGSGGFLLAGKGKSQTDVEHLIAHLRTESPKRTADGQFVIVKDARVWGLENSSQGQIDWLR